MENVNSVINYLKDSNKYIENTLIDDFVNETTIKYFPMYFFEYFAMNMKAQRAIMELSESNLRILSQIIKYAASLNQDWIPLCVSYYHMIKNVRFSKLLEELSNTLLDDSLIENLLFISKDGDNYFGINTIDDLSKIDSIRLEKNDNTPETGDPNILLLNKYGITYDIASNLYKRYGKDVLQLPDSKEKSFLLDIKNIIEGKGTIKEVYTDKEFMVNIDSILRNYFLKIYNDNFYVIDERKKLGTFDDIPIYDAGVDFYMCIYSYGMATNYPIPNNYKDDWNRPSISTDYMCNSIISSDNMHTHVNHCVYGFNQFESNDLALLGANDLGTGGIYNDINVTNPFYQDKLIADVEFRVPDELINNTRFTNNEVYRLRRRIVNGKLQRVNPDYIVYFKKEEEFSNDSIWKESVNAAKDFGIPIVIVDCEKCLINSIGKMEEQLALFESDNGDFHIVSKVVEMIYTINYGYRELAPKLLEKRFNSTIINTYLNRIIARIDEISKSTPIVAIECIDMFIDMLNQEHDKVLKSPHWVEYARGQGYIVEKPQEVIDMLDNKKKEIESIINNSELKQYINQ